jgi:hypothetical protein
MDMGYQEFRAKCLEAINAVRPALTADPAADAESAIAYDEPLVGAGYALDIAYKCGFPIPDSLSAQMKALGWKPPKRIPATSTR